MTEDYSTTIQQVSMIVADAVLVVEKAALAKPLELDVVVREVLRRVGLCVMQHVVDVVAAEMTAQTQAADPALVVQRRPAITVDVVFGELTVESPYLWREGASARPVQTELGLSHRQRSIAVERALTDFGAEQSFGRAAQRFEEHYGWSIGRTSMLRVVEKRAEQAEAYVAQRLARDSASFEQPLGVRPGVEEMLAELDGCEIRTGTLVPANTDEKTAVRQLPKQKRVEEWRDVRVGLVRRLDEVDRTYVARMDTYPQVVEQLFQAAVGRGLSSGTTTVAVADGGNGLREELAVQFPNLQFIYDRPHLNQHLHETAEAMGLDAASREAWVERIGDTLAGGAAPLVLDELASHRGRGKTRVTKLHKHLSRLSDAVHYDAYRERGWPTGSGEVESAHRYIPQQRLKLPGATWDPSTINPMLALRVIRANDWWNDFWAQQHAAAA